MIEQLIPPRKQLENRLVDAISFKQIKKAFDSSMIQPN